MKKLVTYGPGILLIKKKNVLLHWCLVRRGIPRAKYQVAEFTVLGYQWWFGLVLDLKQRDVTLMLLTLWHLVYKYSI